MPDYAKLARTAQRLVEAAGRALTLRAANQAAGDASKPWRGPGTGAATEFEVKGVVLDFQMTADTSEFIRRGDKKAYIAALSAGANDVLHATTLVDGGDVWKVERVKPLKPGDVTLLYELHLRR